MFPPHYNSLIMKIGAGLEVLTVCQEQEEGAVQTGQLTAGPSPRGASMAVHLVCRQQQQSLRTNLGQPES